MMHVSLRSWSDCIEVNNYISNVSNDYMSIWKGVTQCNKSTENYLPTLQLLLSLPECWDEITDVVLQTETLLFGSIWPL